MVVEGDLGDPVSVAAASSWGETGRRRRPRYRSADDKLAAVAVRDHVLSAIFLLLRNVQAVAFGSLTVNGVTETGAAANPSFAAQMLASSTVFAQAGTSNGQGQETFRVPAGDVPGQSMALFLDDSSNPVLDASTVDFADQNFTSVNPPAQSPPWSASRGRNSAASRSSRPSTSWATAARSRRTSRSARQSPAPARSVT